MNKLNMNFEFKKWKKNFGFDTKTTLNADVIGFLNFLKMNYEYNNIIIWILLLYNNKLKINGTERNTTVII